MGGGGKVNSFWVSLLKEKVPSGELRVETKGPVAPSKKMQTVLVDVPQTFLFASKKTNEFYR